MNPSFQAVCEAAALEWDVPALAVGTLIDGERSTVAVGCGPETRFRIASVTKPVTAAVALELLDLEAPTGVWPADVRVRHLLSHTSGFDCELPERDLARFGDGDDALAATVAALPSVRRFLGVEQAWSYANTGFWLAGSLIADRAGSSYEDAIAAYALRPAGLEATSFGEPDVAGTGAEADAGPYPRARRASGGLVSNVHDLLRLGEWLLERERMRIVHAKPVAGVYGLGLFGERVDGVDVWGHGGSYGGFQSSLLLVPDRRAVFCGVTNSAVGSKALYVIENAFFEEAVGSPRRVRETVDVPIEAREAFAGSYANGDGWYEVVPSVDGMVVIFEDGEHDAAPVGQRTFEIRSGHRIRERFDFPVEGFGRFESRLAERVA